MERRVVNEAIDREKALNRKLGKKAVVAPLALLVGCAMSGKPNTADTNVPQAQVAQTEQANKPLRPTMSNAAVTVFKQTRDANKPVRITGNRAAYASTAPSTVNMRSMPAIATAFAAAPQAAAGPVVAGGQQIESPMSDAAVENAIAYAQANAPRSGMQTPTANMTGGPSVGTGFDAIGAEDCCIDTPFAARVPPDPDIAVGFDHVIVVVNTTFAIYDKQGNELQGPTAFGTFFAGVDEACGATAFDPDVIFDEKRGQFIIGLDGSGTDFCVAITTDGDPMGNWNRASFPADVNGEFFDFPHMAAGVDALYVGSNQFGAGFVGGRVFAYDIDDLLFGDPAPAVVQRLVPNFNSTPQPAKLHGALERLGSRRGYPFDKPHYIMTEDFSGANHQVWSWEDPFGKDDFQLVGDVDLATASGVPCPAQSCFPVPVPQQGSTVTLAGNDFRGQETNYRNGTLWTTQTISCNPGTGTVNCVRWAQIDPEEVTPGASTDGVVNAGVFAADGSHRWFPSLAVDRCGNMAIGYSVSSPNMFPSVAVNGRMRRDPAGELRGEVMTVAGTESYRSFQNPAAPNRWGDYSGMAVDPRGGTFWYVGEYAGPSTNTFTNWRTYVSEQSFGCRPARLRD